MKKYIICVLYKAHGSNTYKMSNLYEVEGESKQKAEENGKEYFYSQFDDKVYQIVQIKSISIS